MHEDLYLITICLPLATVLIIAGMRYRATVQQAKARADQDDSLRRIAEKAATAGSETSSALASIGAGLADVRARLTAIEKLLTDVG